MQHCCLQCNNILPKLHCLLCRLYMRLSSDPPASAIQSRLFCT
nr:MAG TPA: hypothetical protein [Caudoviricetes sp.]